MRRAVITLVARIWRENTPNSETTTTFEESDTAVKFLETLLQLSPKNDVQRVLKDQALQVSLDISETRLLLFAQRDTTVPTPFLFVLVLWLAVIFVSFSLFASSNITIVGFLVVFALSAASAIYLIQELGQPFGGLMQISSAPLRDALPPLVQ